MRLVAFQGRSHVQVHRRAMLHNLTRHLYEQANQSLRLANMRIPRRRDAVLFLILQHSVDDAVEIPIAQA